jgi:methyl-accepting chemotaxis protein
MQTKILGLVIILSIITGIVGFIGISQMRAIDEADTMLYEKMTVPIGHLADIATYFQRQRVNLRDMLLAKDAAEAQTYINTIQQLAGEIDTLDKQYEAEILSSEMKALFAAYTAARSNYQPVIDQMSQLVLAGKQEQALELMRGSLDKAKAVEQSIDDMQTMKTRQAGETSASNTATASRASLIMITVIIAGILVGLGVGVVMARSITVPMGIVVNASKMLSVGDLLRSMDEKTRDKVRLRKDEIGEVGKAFDLLIAYMQEMGKAAQTIAENDLTVEVTPKSAQDELGNSFAQMIAGLRETVGQVAQSARDLNAASEQLATAASQAGQATSQIATTVQQVARGTASQTDAVTRTAASVEQMGRAITGVAKGAQEQANSVSKASHVTSQITSAIEQVSGNAQAVTRDSGAAAQAARSGVKTVETTIEGMQSIKSKVDISARKVQEMGQRSDQIGAIVETIEDIASQTNLLALNAAIEAARAGEHGKGFAVVADEVRKLAERASSATKEIGGLIKGIQKTVDEAVAAMNEGAREVESGVSNANQAGQALQDILQAAEAVYQQAAQANQAAQRMTTASGELVDAVDSVSAVVEENTAATEEMAAGSQEVTSMIENIASVSEQNSAAVEEVSAGAEEMSAQVEEVTASAHSLAEMANALSELVAAFKLDGQAQGRPAAGLRRTAGKGAR